MTGSAAGIATGLGLLAAALLPEGAAAEPPLFVSNERSDTMTVIDGTTLEVEGAIETCARPRDMDWAPDGRHLYVACADSNSIGIVDPVAREMTDFIPVIEEPEAFALGPGERLLYVSNEEDAALSVIDLEARTPSPGSTSASNPRALCSRRTAPASG